MATIRTRTWIDKNGKQRTHYQVLVRLKGNPDQSATFERLTDARRWAQQTESAIREGRHFKTAEAKRHTLGELIERYLRDVMPHKQSAKDQTRQLEWWKAQLGSYTLADVTPALLAEYRDKLASGLLEDGSMTREVKQSDGKTKTVPVEPRSPSTVARYLAALSHAFTIAVKEWGWIETNPMLKVTKPKEPQGRVRFLSDEERESLLTACRESKLPELHLIAMLALTTGMRRGEILGLRWPDVDLERRLIVLNKTKNGDRRSVPIVPAVLDLLHEYGKVRRLDTDQLFASRGLKPIWFDSHWYAALDAANIKDFRFHDLRHTAASYLAMSGATTPEIAAVLGHRQLSMVARYSHLSDQHTGAVIERMTRKYFA